VWLLHALRKTWCKTWCASRLLSYNVAICRVLGVQLGSRALRVLDPCRNLQRRCAAASPALCCVYKTLRGCKCRRNARGPRPRPAPRVQHSSQTSRPTLCMRENSRRRLPSAMRAALLAAVLLGLAAHGRAAYQPGPAVTVTTGAEFVAAWASQQVTVMRVGVRAPEEPSAAHSTSAV
jgi:hypothetical protein